MGDVRWLSKGKEQNIMNKEVIQRAGEIVAAQTGQGTYCTLAPPTPTSVCCALQRNGITCSSTGSRKRLEIYRRTYIAGNSTTGIKRKVRKLKHLEMMRVYEKLTGR